MPLSVRPATRRRCLGTLVAVFVLLAGGCDVPGLGPSGDAKASAGPPAGNTDSWILVTNGRPSASPGPVRVASPAPTATPRRSARPTAATPTGVTGCGGVSRPGQLDGLTVRPGAGSATATWFNDGDPSLISYRLVAVAQRLRSGSQPTLDWQTVAPGARCKTVSATVRGLTGGEPYVLWLDAVRTSRIGDGTRDIAIARSGVVTIG